MYFNPLQSLSSPRETRFSGIEVIRKANVIEQVAKQKKETKEKESSYERT